MKYDNRIVLFLDILGFRKHVMDTVDKNNNIEIDNEDKVSSLHNILSQMGLIAGINNDNEMEIKVTQFSDSIVISFLENEPIHAISTFETVLKIIIHLVKNNIICRGALSSGKLIHTSEILFGPALVDAYETESKAAMYPRVIMDSDIYNSTRISYDNESQRLVKHNIIRQYLKKDLDNKYYIDYFVAANYIIKSDDDLISYYKVLRDIIIKGRRFQQPDLKVKYGWMLSKYNSFLTKLNTVDNDLSLSSSVVNYLKKLDYLK